MEMPSEMVVVPKITGVIGKIRAPCVIRKNST
jgi:hypothetical protein